MRSTFTKFTPVFIKYFFSASVVLVLLSACGGDDDNGPSQGQYFIKGSLNGQQTEYRVDAEATVENLALRGAAFESSNANFPSFDFDIDGDAIEPRAYSEASTSMIFRYNESGSAIFFSDGPEDDFIITITEITAETVKGTFSGTLRRATDFSESIFVSDGQFVLRRVD